MHVWKSLEDVLPLFLGPDHECIHRSLDVIRLSSLVLLLDVLLNMVPLSHFASLCTCDVVVVLLLQLLSVTATVVMLLLSLRVLDFSELLYGVAIVGVHEKEGGLSRWRRCGVLLCHVEQVAHVLARQVVLLAQPHPVQVHFSQVLKRTDWR